MVVFIHSDNTSKKYWGTYPPAFKHGTKHASAGRYIPKVVLTSPDTKQYLLSIAYEEWKKPYKPVSRVRAYLEENPIEIEAVPTSSEKEGSGEPKVEDWMNSEGKVIQAKFKKLKGGKVFLTSAKGTEYVYDLKKLASESQERARALAKQKSASKK